MYNNSSVELLLTVVKVCLFVYNITFIYSVHVCECTCERDGVLLHVHVHVCEKEEE